MKALGIVMAYNEADVVHLPCRCLAEAEHELHLFDHGSTDDTAAVARRFGAKVHKVRRKVSMDQIWGVISDYIRERTDCDWVTWLAADEFLRQPDGKPLTLAALKRRRSRGICVIQPLVREFWITDRDPAKGGAPEERLRYYRPRPKMAPCPRSWLRELTRRMPYGLHRPATDWRVRVDRVSRLRWLLDHYPIRSEEQGRRKVEVERRPRPYYLPFRRGRSLVRKARNLERLP